MNQTPMLGILGGMGPQATHLFYRRVVEITAAAADQEHPPALIFSDTEMPDRTGAILRGEGHLVEERLTADVRKLADWGCTVVAVPCNTSHCFLPQVQKRVEIPILNMVELTADTLAEMGKRKAGILATAGTVRTELYQRALAERGIAYALPGDEGQAALMSLIYDDIKAGRPGDPKKFAAAVDALEGQGCDCAILACTELSVYREEQNLPPFYLDAMDVLARSAVLACGKAIRSGMLSF